MVDSLTQYGGTAGPVVASADRLQSLDVVSARTSLHDALDSLLLHGVTGPTSNTAGTGGPHHPGGSVTCPTSTPGTGGPHHPISTPGTGGSYHPGDSVTGSTSNTGGPHHPAASVTCPTSTPGTGGPHHPGGSITGTGGCVLNPIDKLYSMQTSYFSCAD